ncbi:MAG: hypothetical protein QOG64_831 [Acidimicrobiaceae bacterium]|nr:hypothetical protein [Acidimicrobiaceae bacterium]
MRSTAGVRNDQSPPTFCRVSVKPRLGTNRGGMTGNTAKHTNAAAVVAPSAVRRIRYRDGARRNSQTSTNPVTRKWAVA